MPSFTVKGKYINSINCIQIKSNPRIIVILKGKRNSIAVPRKIITNSAQVIKIEETVKINVK